MNINQFRFLSDSNKFKIIITRLYTIDWNESN